MFIKQKDVFFSGGSVGGLTEDALLVFLVEILRNQGKKKFLFLSKSASLNKSVCQGSKWFGDELVYCPEKDTKKTVPGFMSQYNRHRSSAIIKIATHDSICCLSTSFAANNKNINNKTTSILITNISKFILFYMIFIFYFSRTQKDTGTKLVIILPNY